MVTDEQIELLESFDAAGARVLSVYLNLDPARQLRGSFRIAFEDLVRQTREGLDKPGREALRSEVSRVQTWLNGHKPQGKGVAVFSCASPTLWQVHELPVVVEDHLVFESKPDIAPLLELLDEHERYAVALVDKAHARLFTVFLGAVEEHDEFEDAIPGKHRQGGMSDANFQRHHDAHVHWHLKNVARRLAALARHKPFDRLVLAGPEEATSELRGLLPRVLASRVAAVIPGEMSAGTADMLDKTLEVERRIERETEGRILQELMDNAGPNGRATYGLEPTLEALYLNQVRTLVVSAGVHMPGSDCPTCGRLTKGHVVTCPSCGSAMDGTHDLFHRAMGRAVELAGTAEVVHDDAARRLRETGGGLGALLRFR
jgi:peptide chain release factor subunit 1